jgi:uncharacterized protein with gpF-like domain
MADRGHVLTDELLKKLEKDIAKEYRRASKDAAAKLKAYLEEDEAKRKVQESLLKAGKITQKQYNDWVFRHTMMGKRWKDMQEVLARDFLNANKIALQIAKNRMPDVYALNANYATYQLEHDGKLDTSFTLYNHDTAEYLLSQERELMPGPSARKAKEIAQNKDLQWNKRKIQSAVLQGVLQGESPYEVAKRLMDVGQMNYNSAVRYARTMGTNAQNAGRYQAYRRADALGVDLTIEWQATLDGRTRHEHRLMHGQRRDVGQPFVIDGVEILWPAQPNYNGENIPQELIWNCRCTLLSWVKGFEGDTVKTSPKMGEMSFEEWQHEKEKLKTVNQLTASTLTTEEREAQLSASALIKDLRASKIARLEPTRYGTIPSDEDIIAKVSGGDETKGSCVSLSFAYAGNKNGLEVLDFRGGESQSFFSSYYGWKDIAKRFGISEKAKTEIVSATNLVKKAEDGKQYILIAGKHAAVVRRNPNKDSKNLFEYLELQDQNGGWYGIGANTFKDRFGCRKTARRNLLNNEIIEAESYLIDIASLNNDAVFEEVLAYINTEPTKQKKGRYGYAK